MRNIKLVIQYDGTSYHGWQRQPDVITVESVLVASLEKIIGERVKLYAAARTDSSVHARFQVVNFKTANPILPHKLRFALNGLLPDDVVVAKVACVPDNFNARYDAKGKVYRYTILNREFRSPFDLRYCYFFPYPIDVVLMTRAAELLIGKHDFSSFQARFGERKNPARTVRNVKIFSRAGFIYTDIQADGFLTHMVRIIMGTLLEAGRGKISPEDVKQILEGKDRSRAGPTLPPCGLCLMKVLY